MLMKRLALVVLTVILTISCFSGSAFAAAKTIEAIKGTPTIDGTIDSVWKSAKSVKTASWASDEGPWATGKFSVMWDENYLYVLAQVTDKLVTDKAVDPWNKDCIEIFLDELNEKAATYDANDGQYRINFKNETSGGGAFKADTFKSAAKVVTGGYVIETAIPWVALKGKAAVGTIAGIDFQVADDSTGTGIRDGVCCWNDGAADKYCNTSSYGNLKLVEVATAAALPTTGSEIPVPVIMAIGLCLLAAGMFLVIRKKRTPQSN
ncbi:MAG: sugar-binding protein [Clostridiaceae bacterium]